MRNQVFARVKIDALLAPQGRNTQHNEAVRFEVWPPDGIQAGYMLCNRHSRSDAVIEAKRFSVSSLAGRMKVRAPADNRLFPKT